ncbi:MAG: hypothetical protein M3Z66_22140, partial [Chloroflexota bacterium]|nr:hypothetical protein [Chloroflexota bacterium]
DNPNIQSQAGAYCDLNTGQTPDGLPCPWFVGGTQTGQTVLDEEGAYFTTPTNPSPVWKLSSAWNALLNPEYRVLAQVGMEHTINDGRLLVFAQYQKIDGTYSLNYTYNAPTGNELYRVLYNQDYYGNPQSFSFCWNEGCSSAPAQWAPNTLQALGEIQNYQARSAPDVALGDQAMGAINNPVVVTGAYYSLPYGQHITANFNYSDTQYRNHANYQSFSESSSSAFGIWDNRCSNS